MKLLDTLGKIGERAHVGSTTTAHLKDLFHAAGFSDIHVEKKKLNWFWGIMIGTGQK